jgi:TRAP-type mannitol/chloroaromatic compound transport system permease small subunit
MLKKAVHFIDHLSEWNGKITHFLIYGFLGTLVYEIFARYLFNSPTIWAHEMSTFFYGAYFLLGAAFSLRRGGMISVDILVNRLSRRARAFLNVITFFFLLSVCLALLWLGGKDALYSWSIRECTNSTWGPPLYPLRMVIPVSAFLLMLQGMADFIREACIAFTGKELEEI